MSEAVARSQLSGRKMLPLGQQVPIGADVAEGYGCDDVAAVELPDRRRAVVVAPDDVVLAVAVEIAGVGDVPVGPDVAQERRADDLTAVELPDRCRPVVVAPQDVAVAVAVEIAGAGDLPVGARA